MTDLSVVTANLYKGNMDVAHDLRKLCNSGAHVIGLNESRLHNDVVYKVAKSHGFHPLRYDDNTMLMREDIPLLGVEHRLLAEETKTSHRRSGNVVTFRWDGQVVSVLNLHLSTAQQHLGDWDGGLVEGPEGTMWVNSMKQATGWTRELMDLGHRVVVVGDMNWSYVPRKEETFRWAPVKAFHRRCGMHCQFQEEMIPRKASDRRLIEYVFWRDQDFGYLSQSFVGPESSDHPFHLVSLSPCWGA